MNDILSLATRLRSIDDTALISALACLGLLVSGCGLGTAAGPVRSGELAGPIADVESLEGLKVSIGSKNFSENIILGKMAVSLFASAGAKVTDRTALVTFNAEVNQHMVAINEALGFRPVEREVELVRAL